MIYTAKLAINFFTGKNDCPDVRYKFCNPEPEIFLQLKYLINYGRVALLLAEIKLKEL